MLPLERRSDRFSQPNPGRDEFIIPLTAEHMPGVLDSRCQSVHDPHSKYLNVLDRIANSLEKLTKAIPLICPPMSVKEVANFAQVQEKTVYTWKAKGLLKPISDQTTPLLFRREDVDDFLRQPRRGRSRP